jgi:hypothetical protein
MQQAILYRSRQALVVYQIPSRFDIIANVFLELQSSWKQSEVSASKPGNQSDQAFSRGEYYESMIFFIYANS